MTEDEKMEIYNKGVAEGVKHQTPSPQTLEEIRELKAEWHEFKARALTVLISSCFLFAGYGIWVGTIQANVQSNLQRLEVQTNRISTIDTRQQASDVTAAEIKAKLSAIETSLIDIRQAIKGIR